jgi:hypothetical protein
MLVTNKGPSSEFHDDSEQMLRDIGTARVVADVFRQHFFMIVWT